MSISLSLGVASPHTPNVTSTDDSDQALLGRIASGELEALDEVYNRYGTISYSIAYRITYDASLAEDIVQEAFLGAWRHAANYREDRASVKTWLLSIVHHKAIDAVRRRRPTSQLAELDEFLPAHLVVPDVWAEVSAGLDAATVHLALAVLPSVEREVIELAYFGGLTQREIAAQTGTPLGTIKTRVRRGLRRLRCALEQASPATQFEDSSLVEPRPSSGGHHA